MPREPEAPRELGLAVVFLRALRRWKQSDLAAAAGIDKGQISRFEMGIRIPSWPILARLAAAARVPFSLVEQVLPMLRRFGTAGEDGLQAADPANEERQAKAGAIAVSRVVEAEAAGRLASLSTPTNALVSKARDDRIRTLCERLCAESERAAAADSTRAVQLAKLALRVTATAPGEGANRVPLEGYIWAFVANGRRVANDLPAADEAIGRAEKLCFGGGTAALGPLAASRILDLKASLRRAQRRFEEALRLLDEALALGGDEVRERILLKKAFTFEQMGEYGRAVETLREAALLIDDSSEPHQVCVLRFNLAVNLCHAGRHSEAAPLVAKTRELAAALGNEQELIRVCWLEGRVAAGLGRDEEALAVLEEVRAEFADREMSYDAALVSLELAVLHLERGRTAEVKSIAHEMAPIFEAQGVHEGALAALRLFRDAAEQERITAELARRLVAYLYRAQHDPQLRFEA